MRVEWSGSRAAAQCTGTVVRLCAVAVQSIAMCLGMYRHLGQRFSRSSRALVRVGGHRLSLGRGVWHLGMASKLEGRSKGLLEDMLRLGLQAHM